MNAVTSATRNAKKWQVEFAKSAVSDAALIADSVSATVGQLEECAKWAPKPGWARPDWKGAKKHIKINYGKHSTPFARFGGSRMVWWPSSFLQPRFLATS